MEQFAQECVPKLHLQNLFALKDLDANIPELFCLK